MILTMYFACTREVIQKYLNQNSSKCGTLFKHLDLNLAYFTILVLVLQHLKHKHRNFIFFQENSDFPCLHFTMEKVKIILAIKFLFVNRFSKFLWHFSRLLGCIRVLRSHFAGGFSEQGDMQKGSFQRWCKESKQLILP